MGGFKLPYSLLHDGKGETLETRYRNSMPAHGNGIIRVRDALAKSET